MMTAKGDTGVLSKKICFGLLLSMLQAALYAQNYQGAVRGTVSDGSGPAIKSVLPTYRRTRIRSVILASIAFRTRAGHHRFQSAAARFVAITTPSTECRSPIQLIAR